MCWPHLVLRVDVSSTRAFGGLNQLCGPTDLAGRCFQPGSLFPPRSAALGILFAKTAGVATTPSAELEDLNQELREKLLNMMI